MEKALLRRLEMLEVRHSEPVRIVEVYRMPDGSEVERQFKDYPINERKIWMEETAAELIDVIIRDGDRVACLVDKGRR